MPAPKRIIVYLTTEQHVRKQMKEKGGMDAYDFVLGVSCWNEQSRKLEDAPRAG